MIIQCPSCKTKFSVDSTQLAGVSDPTFHCSRCGHYFGANTNDAPKAPAPSEPKVSEPKKDDFDPLDSIEEDLENPQGEQLDLIPEEHGEIGDLFEKKEDEEPPVKVDWPDTSPEFDLPEEEFNPPSEPNDFSSKARDSIFDSSPVEPKEVEPVETKEEETDWRIEEKEDSSFSKMSVKTELDDKDYGRNRKATERYSAEQYREIKKEILAEQKDTPEDSKKEESEDLSSESFEEPSKSDDWNIEDTEPELEEDFLDVEEIESTPSFSSGSEPLKPVYGSLDDEADDDMMLRLNEEHLQKTQKRNSSWASLLFLWFFPFIISGLLWFWGQNLDKTPVVFSKLLNLEGEKLPQVPPIGLGLVDLKSSRVSLDGGKEVLEITGNILNTTLIPYQDIKIEAKTFGKNNQALNHIIVDANNGLRKAKQIKTLKIDTLDTLQQGSSTEALRLDPSEKASFRIIFSQVNNNVEWFSTRIYSATQS